MATIEALTLHAVAQGVGCFFGCAVGVPLALISWTLVDERRTRRFDRRVEKKTQAKIAAFHRFQKRNACARCGHPRDAHDSEPDGCRAEEFNRSNGARVTCECERYLQAARAG